MARRSIYPPSVTPGIPKLGILLDGWIETTFGNVLKSVSRKAPLVDDIQYQLVTAKRNRGGIVPRSKLLGKEIKTKTQFFVNANDFLISKRQIVHGACGVVPSDLDGAIVSNEYAVLQVKDGLLLSYLNYYCHSIHFQQTCFQASVGVDIEKMIFNLRSWMSFKIHLPPIEEQHKIAEILGAWDEAITLTERLIEGKQKRKKGLMQQLLTGKVRFPGFEGSDEWLETKIGRFPADWDLVTLGSLGSFSKGSGIKKSELVENGLPCVRYGEIYTIHHFQIKEFRSFIRSETASKSKKIYAGDLLFAGSGETLKEIGKCVAYTGDEEAYAGGDIIILRLSKGNPKFLGFLLNNDIITRQKYSLGQGQSVVHIYARHLKNILVPLPSLEEQGKIATILQACDEEITLLRQKAAALREQKKGLMQQLLTGKVRVKG